MEIIAKIEEISEKQTRSFKDGSDQEQFVEFFTMVLSNGLERIACETATTNLAKTVEKMQLKKNDTVRVMLLTNCNEQKTKDGGTFMANRTKVYHIAKIPDFPETKEAPAF